MRSYFLSFLFSTLLLFSFTACGGGGSSTPDNSGGDSGGTPPATTTGVTGVVSDMEGNALEGVSVYIGSSTTSTDSSGKYTLATSASTSLSLTAELKNYAKNSKVVVVEDSKMTTQDIKLAKVDTIDSFDTSTGATIKAKDAKVELPANGYTLEDGTPYTGEVTAKATYNKVTTVNGLEAFPGEFLGQESGTGDTKVLQSYGFIDVTLESSTGDRLKLNSTATSKLTYPMDSNIKDTPATIPLWYYDTTKGIWIEDGFATYDATTNTYSGDVTHFSTWNLDQKFDGATLRGCVEDASGNRVAIADLFISGEGWSKHKVNNDTTGNFELINAPSDSNISLIATAGGLSSIEHNITLAPSQVMDINGCLTLDVNASELFSTIKARVVDGDNNPISNQNISINDGVSTYIGSATSDINGTIEMTFKRSNIDKVKLTTYYNNVSFEKTFTINPVDSKHDLGDMVLAMTTFNGCVVLADGSTNFDVNSSNEIATKYPYNTSISFDTNGLFTISMQKDNLSHDVYANTYTEVNASDYHNREKNYLLTGKISFDATANSITHTDPSQCIKLHDIAPISKSATASISTTNTGVYLEVVFVQSNSNWGKEIVGVNDKKSNATFDINNNGSYIIKQSVDYNANTNMNITFNGTMSVVIDGTTHTITIPTSTSGQTAEWWSAFRIDAYDGNIDVVELNKAW